MSRIEQIGDATPTTRIYALCEFPSWEPRYIGKTIQYMGERHKAHIRDAKRGRNLPVHRWLRKKIAAGERLAIKLIEFVPPGADWVAREKFWIDTYRTGGRLLNLTDGGEGLPGLKMAQSHKDKIAAALRTGGNFCCFRCGKQFWRKLRDIKRGHNKFCSRDCSNRRHK